MFVDWPTRLIVDEVLVGEIFKQLDDDASLTSFLLSSDTWLFTSLWAENKEKYIESFNTSNKHLNHIAIEGCSFFKHILIL